MDLIANIDEHNYNENETFHSRKAVRGIIFIDNKLVTVSSDRFHDYIFPGGGQEDGEDDVMTLVREVKEETGLDVIVRSIKEYGYVIEKRKSVFLDYRNLIYTVYYYLCEVDFNKISQLKLEKYEEEMGYKMKLIDLEEAIKQNELILPHIYNQAPWVKRETIVLKHLRKYLQR